MIRVFGWQTSTAGEHEFRIGLPFPLLDLTRFEWSVGQPGPDIHDQDVVFAHRLAGRSDLWHELCADPNVLCVYDMDDDLLCVDPQNVACYRLFHPLEPETRRNVLAADVVTVSSPGLLERYSKLHPRVVYLPIVIPDDLPEWPLPQHDGLIVGWAGSTHKRQDWPGVTRALVEFAKLAPEVRFRMYGADYTGSALGSRCEAVPFNPDVRRFWRSLDFDIGVAPLTDTEFNRGKTFTKLIEYGSRHIPTISSAVGQNTDWIDHGVNGFLVHDPSEWVAYLLALTDDETRTAMAKAAYESACEWTVSKHVHRWEAVFSGVAS
jgi:glycosyltransferase involved in cell wall biosynthesis